MNDLYFSGSRIVTDTTESNRIVNTPSTQAKSILNYLQELGTLKCMRSHISNRDKLDSYLIVFILKGSGYFSFKGEEYPVSAGDGAFINCNTDYTHHCNDDDPWEIAWIHFNGPLLSEFHKIFLNRNGREVFRPNNFSEYLSVLTQIDSLMSKKPFDYEFAVSELIGRLYTAVIMDVNSDEQGSAVDDKLMSIREYVEKNFCEKITLQNLSQRFYISKYYLSHAYKKKFGITVMQYLTECRINHSKRLLRFSNMSVGEIAKKSGFDDACYFNKVFRDIEGSTAGKFRKLWQN